MSSVAWPAEGGEEKGEIVLGCYGGLYIIGLNIVCVCIVHVCILYVCASKKNNL